MEFPHSNRTGLGALPGELFYSRMWTTNYQLGLTGAPVRDPVHPASHKQLGNRACPEKPRANSPGSVVLPPSQYRKGVELAEDTAVKSTRIAEHQPTLPCKQREHPNLHPDVILKTALTPSQADTRSILTWQGLLRSFRAVT